jgi:hypothetical protein
MKGLGAVVILLVLGACSPKPDALSVSADAAVSSARSGAAPELTDAGIWSASGILLRDKPVVSPDGRFILQWTDAGINVSGEAHGLLTKREMGRAPPEILWSPSGVYVAITWSDDSPIPVWSVDAYYLGSKVPHDIGIVVRSPEDTKLSLANGLPEYNCAAVAWLNNESTLLMVVEKPLLRSWMNGAYLGAVNVSLADVALGAEFDGTTLLDTNRADLGPRLLRDLEQ